MIQDLFLEKIIHIYNWTYPHLPLLTTVIKTWQIPTSYNHWTLSYLSLLTTVVKIWQIPTSFNHWTLSYLSLLTTVIQIWLIATSYNHWTLSYLSLLTTVIKMWQIPTSFDITIYIKVQYAPFFLLEVGSTFTLCTIGNYSIVCNFCKIMLMCH